MSVASMTGFARAEGRDDTRDWTWEAKSVNHRNLDIRCRVPPGLEALEPVARKAIGRRVQRGHVELSLRVIQRPGHTRIAVNSEALAAVLAAAAEIADVIDAAPPRLDGLLAIRGVCEAVEEDEDEAVRDAREEAMRETLILALDGLAAARAREGAELLTLAVGHLEAIAEAAAAARSCAAVQPEALREKLRQQVSALLDAVPALPDERLAQEAAILATKSDVREELDRLDAHVVAARALLEAAEPVGRRLDFLAQEFNRETNTLCSKSSDIELTRIGLELKATIEQFREQVQNIE